MRFALLVRASRESELCTTPLTADTDKLLRYATELTNAGVLLDAQGLQPTEHAIRVVMTREPESGDDSRRPRKSAGGGGGGNDDNKQRLGASVTSREKKVVTLGGPFPAEETISAWWIIDVPCAEDAVKWAKQSPFPLVGQTATVEIRQLFAPDDIQTKENLTLEETAGSEAIQKLFRG
ncbi:ribosome biosynthesis protein rrb1 [Ascosphaera pollenicola]|nr:ribosome biosynthesis protein rrb1 [Ascosphaera pollenicola]